jgi:uncharacterized protein YbbC (DUF1343 family)/CubicO group peptidase (beta-lactamase class C family)
MTLCYRYFVLIVIACLVCVTAHAQRFSAIDRLVEDSMARKEIPGAVVVIGHNGKVVFHHAYGVRSLEPTREEMTEDTIFDMASLTKCMATTISVMQLYEKGMFRLNDPVAKYLPEFGQQGKESITIRALMTHYSGLAPDVDLKDTWQGKEEGLRRAFTSTPLMPVGSEFRYSDINFIVLGALVEKLSGKTLDEYARENVFSPLGMKNTRFLPPGDWRPKIAPTEYDEHQQMLRGVVHDPTARRMGGVAGHAGMFSTAKDVSRFAQELLNRLAGKSSHFPLRQLTAQKMVIPEQPATGTQLRGLGWDIESVYSSNRGELFPVGSFGHTGFTGTSLWIDPSTNTYGVLLTNAVHPHLGKGVVGLRAAVATAAASALNLKADDLAAHLTGYNESMTGLRRWQARNGQVKTGIDVLEGDNFAELRQLVAKHGGRLRVALLTNPTGLDQNGRRTIDILHKEAAAAVPGFQLTRLFSPEHGIHAAQDTTDVRDTVDEATGLPVTSLYGATDAQRRPSDQVMSTLDAVIIDLADAGVRFYTYETLTGYLLEAAAKSHAEVVILDRPNPLGGAFVQGPFSLPGQESYTTYMPEPVRHGMTVGELAGYFNGERHLISSLTVVQMQGWERGDWYDSTGLEWTNPSPNLRSLDAATVYPGIGLIEQTNLSVGRGTDTPFLYVGAPWINARELAQTLNHRFIPGIRFTPVSFTPSAPYPYARQLCHGVQLVVIDRNALDAPELGLEIASVVHKLYVSQFEIDKMEHLLANTELLAQLKAGDDPRHLRELWQNEMEKFFAARKAYLLY